MSIAASSTLGEPTAHFFIELPVTIEPVDAKVLYSSTTLDSRWLHQLRSAQRPCGAAAVMFLLDLCSGEAWLLQLPEAFNMRLGRHRASTLQAEIYLDQLLP
jgi:hypothetical protein